MDIEGNWERIKNHRERLSASEIRGLAAILFRDKEEWLAGKARQREDEALVIEFLACLGMDGSGKAINILLNTLETGDEARQAAAAEALKLCPCDLTMEALADMTRGQAQAAVKAGEVILSYGDAGTDVLWRLWFGADKPESLKARVLELLTEAADPRIEPLAFLAFLTGNDALVDAALKAAEKIDARALWANIVPCLSMADWKLRGRAARLLGKWKESRALGFLLDMGADPDPWVEEERQKAIANIDI